MGEYDSRDGPDDGAGGVTSRRRLLAGVGVALALAGCSGDDSEDGEGPERNDNRSKEQDPNGGGNGDTDPDGSENGEDDPDGGGNGEDDPDGGGNGEDDPNGGGNGEDDPDGGGNGEDDPDGGDPAPANFVVEIVEIPDSIEEETTMTVGIVVENTGEEEDTQPVVFDVDGQQQDNVVSTLGGGETDVSEFSYEVGSDAPEQLTVTVSTDDDEAESTVDVTSQDIQEDPLSKAPSALLLEADDFAFGEGPWDILQGPADSYVRDGDALEVQFQNPRPTRAGTVLNETRVYESVSAAVEYFDDLRADLEGGSGLDGENVRNVREVDIGTEAVVFTPLENGRADGEDLIFRDANGVSIIQADERGEGWIDIVLLARNQYGDW